MLITEIEAYIPEEDLENLNIFDQRKWAKDGTLGIHEQGVRAPYSTRSGTEPRSCAKN
jgi:hypothetical protein